MYIQEDDEYECNNCGKRTRTYCVSNREDQSKVGFNTGRLCAQCIKKVYEVVQELHNI